MSLLLHIVENLVKGLLLDLKHDVAVHLDEPAIAVPRESIVSGTRRESLDSRLVKTEVENRVHHAGHRELRAGTHRNEQGMLG